MPNSNSSRKYNIFITPFLLTLIPLIIGVLLLVGTVKSKNIDLDKRIKIYTEWADIFSLFNTAIFASSLLATVIGIQQAYTKYEQDSEEARRRSAFEYLNNITLGRFIDIRNKIETKDINPYRRDTNYFTDRKKIHDVDKNIDNTNSVRDILNTFDLISTAIRYKVIDEKIAKDQLFPLMSAYWRWSKSYVLLARMLEAKSTEDLELNKSLVYADFESQMYNWRDKSQSNLTKEQWRNNWQKEEFLEQHSEKENKEKRWTLKEWAKQIYKKEHEAPSPRAEGHPQD